MLAFMSENCIVHTDTTRVVLQLWMVANRKPFGNADGAAIVVATIWSWKLQYEIAL